MRRLFVLVEGPTEETFVNRLLGPYLSDRGFVSTSAKVMGRARQRERRGGVRAWSAVERDILGHLRQDKKVTVTTMVDYYGMPETGQRAWPDRAIANGDPRVIESAMSSRIGEAGGDRSRFVPFVVMHEFEALLFSNCDAFARGIGKPRLSERLQKIRDSFGSPEDINDSPETHPAKRVTELMPDYRKPLHGERAAREIGLDRICEECSHFREWLERLTT